MVVLDVQRLHPNIRIAHTLYHETGMAVGPRLIFDHLVMLVLEGEGQTQIGGRVFNFSANHLYFFEPFVKHYMTTRDGLPTRHLALHFDLAPGVPGHVEHPSRRRPYRVRLTHGLSFPAQTVLPAVHPGIRALTEAVAAFNDGHPIARLRATSLLQGVLTDLLDQRSRADTLGAVEHRNRVKLDRVSDYVKTHLGRPLTVESMAEVADLSPSHLNRLMRDWIGQTPYEFLSECRIDAARRLLADPNLSIKEIAVKTGFRTSYHFSRVFRRIDGLAPTQYREALLASRHASSNREPDRS